MFIIQKKRNEESDLETRGHRARIIRKGEEGTHTHTHRES